ncbi:hypothetical protein AB0383_19405 [Amycolatopsis sp. NPDC051373]|uniref:hypothetical protein n=1 Tax=Amycolatopsis sp. NPDC051373 TaxID=3155801 RepID=UPI00344DDFF3
MPAALGWSSPGRAGAWQRRGRRHHDRPGSLREFLSVWHPRLERWRQSAAGAAAGACRSEARCAGAVDRDGTPYGCVVHTGLAEPHLLLASGDMCLAVTCPVATTDPAARELLATAGPAWCYQIDGARHFDFSDYDAYYLAAPLRSQLALGDLDEVLTITGAYVTAFLDHTVHARPEPLLQAGNTEFPQVKAQRRPA